MWFFWNPILNIMRRYSYPRQALVIDFWSHCPFDGIIMWVVILRMWIRRKTGVYPIGLWKDTLGNNLYEVLRSTRPVEVWDRQHSFWCNIGWILSFGCRFQCRGIIFYADEFKWIVFMYAGIFDSGTELSSTLTLVIASW